MFLINYKRGKPAGWDYLITLDLFLQEEENVIEIHATFDRRMFEIRC